MKVIIENISRSRALELIKNVQDSICQGLAIQGRNFYETIWCDTVTASISPKEKGEDGSDMEIPDFGSYTFNISSDYWSEYRLREFAGL